MQRETRPTAVDLRFMRRALALARRGWGRVHPNPMVGAVVVRDGVEVGAGFHAAFGGDHAEIAALRAAGERARGATLYCTLEPCDHHGKTPPCTAAILEAGVARVVYGAEDPGEDAGGGAARLRAAGVDVVGGVERVAVRRQDAAFFHAAERRSPYVALKYGLTLDARLAAAPGESTRVTGRAAVAEVHRLRAGFDAIMVGGATARIDDPRLTVRGRVRPRIAPVRAVLDPNAGLDPRGYLARTAAEVPVWLFCADDAPEERRDALAAAGVRVILVPRERGGLALDAVLDTAWAEGLRSILCEGGGRLGAALLRQRLVQRLYLFYAPALFGEAGVPAFPGAAGPSERGSWRLASARRVGGDALLVLDREG